MRLNERERAWLALTMIPGVGSAHFIRLLARFHHPEAVLRASRAQLREVVGPQLSERIAEYGGDADVDGQERAMARCGARLVTLENPDYPLRLAEIYDPPLALFVRGALTADAPCVAIVGTRRASHYGLRLAERFGRDLAARGITVVSGLATGVDAAAHRGAVDAGGQTVAVLGNGVDVVYPRGNATLMDDVAATGAVVSQFVMGAKPSRGNFPYRNRIISGMSLGTLVIEAPLRSGSLITARQAAEQGREVFAVPGPVDAETSAGPHRLIQEGARLVTSVDDLLEELHLERDTARTAARQTASPAPTTPAAASRTGPGDPGRAQADGGDGHAGETVAAPRPDLSPGERAILAALAPDGSYVDDIALQCRVAVSEALSTLTLLELKGVVRQFSGKRFAPR